MDQVVYKFLILTLSFAMFYIFPHIVYVLENFYVTIFDILELFSLII